MVIFGRTGGTGDYPKAGFAMCRIIAPGVSGQWSGWSGNFCYRGFESGRSGAGQATGDEAMTGEKMLMGVALLLLLAAAILMLVMVIQLKAMRHEVEATRLQLAKMDWGAMLLNGVQQLKLATVALEQIDKRLQKLEAIEKVQLSHINVRQGV
jgi:hypothetical protein